LLAATGAEAIEESGEAAAGLEPADETEDGYPRIVRALRNRNFRLFWSGNFLSNIGTWMQNVAQGWLVLTLTGSAFWLGVVGFAGSIPFLFLTLFGGVIADRVNKRKLMLVTQTAMMLLAFLLAGLAYWKIVTIWEVAAIAFLNGVAMAMNAPSFQSMFPRLVRREDLTNAIALNSAQFNMSRILGPSLGGYAMALVGIAGNFFLNGVSFLAVLLALMRIRFPEEKKTKRESVLHSLAEGFRYVRRQPQMFALVWMIAVSGFLAYPFLNFIPYFARMQLHTGEKGLGWLLACSGAGAVLAAITVAWQGQIRHRGAMISFCGAAVMAVVVLFCYSRSFAFSAFLMLLEGYGMILMFSSVNVAMQHLSSDEMRGRVTSIFTTCFLGLPPLGSLLVGALSRLYPTGHVLAVMAGLALLTFLGFFACSPALRELD
jgi:MFS family permease